MKKRNYSPKQLLLIVLLSLGMIVASVVLNQIHPPKSSKTSGETIQSGKVQNSDAGEYQGGAMEEDINVTNSAISASEQRTRELEEQSENMATFLQGPKSWKERREWSGK